MEFRELVRRRRMVRNYEPKLIDPQVVERLLQHAIRAPSAGFSQGWAFLVLETPEDRQRFWESQGGPGYFGGTANAPLLVVPLSHKQAYLDRYAEPDKGWSDRDESRWPVPYWDIDAGFAAMLMLLTAVDEGLGALFFGVFDVSAFRAAFGVPDELTPIGVVAVGHPAPDTPSPSLRRGRRELGEVVHRGRWGVRWEDRPR